MQTTSRQTALSTSLSAAEIKLICVAPQFVDKVWPYVRRWLDQALIRGHADHSLDLIYRQLKAKTALLWVAHRKETIHAACTTEIVKAVEGNDRWCVISTYGGSMPPSWEKMLERIEQYARDENCALMRLYGRSGWNRVLRDRGYHQAWVALEKRLGHGQL